MQEEYARVWQLEQITGNYSSSKHDLRACDCCGKGKYIGKPLVQCKIKHKFICGEERVAWVCLHCLRKGLKVHTDICEVHKRAQRAWLNEREFEHLLTPLRGQLSAYIEKVPYLQAFMMCVQNREAPPPYVLSQTNQFVSANFINSKK